MRRGLSQIIPSRTTYTVAVFIFTLLVLLVGPGSAEVSSTGTRTESNLTSSYVIIEFERNAPFPGADNTPWPRGDVTLGGVPFRIPEQDPSTWASEDLYVPGPNPHTLDITVNQQGVARVYTLINTGGGAPGPTAYAWLEFWGDSGAYFRKDLVGDVDIRDYNYGGWTNTINGTTTVNVFLHNPGVYNGERRLDMQIIDLPDAFLTQTLTQIRLSDNGGINLQRTILEGVTVLTEVTTSDFSCSNVTEIPQTECAALVALYNSTNGPGWNNKNGWLLTLTPCSWYGVSCTGGHVTALHLSSNQLVGSIPAALGNLTELGGLYLCCNQLSGNIPSQLGNLVKLGTLSLGGNQLSGSIPPQLGNLTLLNGLELSANQLGGIIPGELGNLTNLQYLLLDTNQLGGNLPNQLGNLTHLEWLFLNDNQFSGSLPGNLVNLTHLVRLFFGNTSLCEPGDATFQAWLASISDLQRTNVTCATPIILSTSSQVVVELVSTSTICTGDFGLYEPQNTLVFGNYLYSGVRTFDFEEQFQTGTQLIFYINPKGLCGDHTYLSTDPSRARVEQINDSTWRIYWEDYNDGDFNDLVVEVRATLDTTPPPVPDGRVFTCAYDSTSGGSDYYKVTYSWNSVNDVGSAGMHQYPYWSQISEQSDFRTVPDWYNSWDNVTSRTSSISFIQNTTLYAHVRSRDANDNQSAWSAADSLVLNSTNCSGTPVTNTPTPRPTSTPIPPTATTTPSPIPPTPTPNGTPTPLLNCRMVNQVKVCANSFSDNSNGWTTGGTVQIGDYTIVEESNVIANGNALTGSGKVSMLISTDSRHRTSLFHDNFSIDTQSGLMTPRAISGYQFLLTNLVGFKVQQDLYQLSLDVLKGELTGTVNLAIVIPNNRKIKAISFILDHTGTVKGSLADIAFELGMVMLNIRKATLGADGLSINEATLQLPTSLGGASAALTVGNARITGDGRLTLADGSVHVDFPNIQVGGTNGFAIKGAKASLSIRDQQYLFSGAGTFTLPGISSGTGSCKLGTKFTLASSPPPVREASLKIDGCIKIPIANTGFFLTSVSGTVHLDESTVEIKVGIGIEGGPDIPGLGAAVSGEPTAYWSNRWAVGLEGALRIFRWQVANADLNLTSKDGLKGALDLTVLGVIDGSGQLRIWRTNSQFHFSGDANVTVHIPEGRILSICAGPCIIVPAEPIRIANASAKIGEFNFPGGSRRYGLKGQVRILNYEPAFFVDTDGNLSFNLDGQQQSQLLSQLSVFASTLDVSTDEVYPFLVDDTSTLIVAMGRDSGGLTLSLTDPNGRIITPTTEDPDIFYTAVATQTLYSIANPQPGTWSASVGNYTGNEHFLLTALTTLPPPEIMQPPTLSAADNGYIISLQATGYPTATYSLFYDDDATGSDGIPIATGVAANQTDVFWDITGVPQGTYYVYALLDHPLFAPIIAYSATPVTVVDNSPPDPPTILSVKTTRDTATVIWQPSSAPDVAGYRLYYREPEGRVTHVADIPDRQQSTHIQEGLYLSGGWELSISAYDTSGNESVRGASIRVNISLGKIHLPLIISN